MDIFQQYPDRVCGYVILKYDERGFLRYRVHGDELQVFLELGKEIACNNTPEDLAAKIKYYLSHESDRETICKAGYERCRRDHAWHKRFEMAFKEMSLQ